MRSDQHEQIDVLGVRVSAITMDDATDRIQEWIRDGVATYVCVTGAHGVMESRRDAKLRAIHNDAGMVTPDGMPLVWLARMFGRRRTERVYGPDLMRRLTAISAERGYRQFYFGGAEGVAENLSRVLTRHHPGLVVAGCICPPFRQLSPEEDEEIVAQINGAQPDIVWVGLSTPKQERWMAEHVGRIHAPVMIGVGAAFDFLSGTKAQAPVWMQRNGLEWLFRFCSEPRRLWRRYLLLVVGFPAALAMHAVRQRLRL